MLLAIGPLVEDKRFRRVTDPGVFTAVASTVPALAPWLPVMDPISGVYPMGGLHNSMRRLAVDGTPVATGLAAVGDSAAPPIRPSAGGWRLPCTARRVSQRCSAGTARMSWDWPRPWTTSSPAMLSPSTSTKPPMTAGGWLTCATPCSARQRLDRNRWRTG